MGQTKEQDRLICQILFVERRRRVRAAKGGMGSITWEVWLTKAKAE